MPRNSARAERDSSSTPTTRPSTMIGPGVVDADRGGAAQPFEAIDRAVGAVAAQHGVGPPGERGANLGQARRSCRPQSAPAAIRPVRRAGGSTAERGAPGARDDRREALRSRRLRVRLGRAGDDAGRGRSGRIGVAAEVDARRLGARDSARIERRPRRRRRGQSERGGRGERGALRDQLRLGLADQRVLVDAQEHRAEAGQRGDEEQRREQDGAQPQPRPVALEPALMP